MNNLYITLFLIISILIISCKIDSNKSSVGLVNKKPSKDVITKKEMWGHFDATHNGLAHQYLISPNLKDTLYQLFYNSSGEIIKKKGDYPMILIFNDDKYKIDYSLSFEIHSISLPNLSKNILIRTIYDDKTVNLKQIYSDTTYNEVSFIIPDSLRSKISFLQVCLTFYDDKLVAEQGIKEKFCMEKFSKIKW